MTRSTSKASYLETRESGQESTQSDKILEIISLGGNLSLQEIMQIYRGKHGNIELSSVSARCNKLKAGGKIIEAEPRKCSLTDKTVNPLTANKCTHEFYKTANFMQLEKARKDPNIAWTGKIVQKCKDCDMDIAFARRVQVKTAEQYLRSMK